MHSSVAFIFLLWLVVSLFIAYRHIGRIQSDRQNLSTLSRALAPVLLLAVAGAEGEDDSAAAGDTSSEGPATQPESDQEDSSLEGGMPEVLERCGLSGSALATWIGVLEDARSSGALVNPSAYLDAVWNQERERLRWLRFMSRNAVMLGLIITSFNLAVTLQKLEPVFRQVGNQSFEAASKAIQDALAGALGPMATAFQASFAGLIMTLVLGAVADGLSRVQDGYLEELDRFLQGRMLPWYAVKIAEDRSDSEASLLARIDEMLKTMRSQHEAVVSELTHLGPSLTESAKIMKNQLSNFAKSLKVLEELAAQTTTVGLEIRTALQEGYAVLQASHQRFAEELGIWLSGAVEPHLLELRRQGETWDGFRSEALAELGSAARSVDDVLAATQAAQEASRKLADSLESARAQWEASGRELVSLPEQFGRRMQEAGASVVSETMRKHDHQIRDLNRQVGERFSELLRAIGTTLGG